VLFFAQAVFIGFYCIGFAEVVAPLAAPLLAQLPAPLNAIGDAWALHAIDLTAGAVAAAIVYAIYLYLNDQAVPARWSDGRRAYYLRAVRENLLAAAREPAHPRAWRPQLLVFSDSTERRARLLRFAHSIEGGAGLTTVVRMIESKGDVLARRNEATAELAAEIEADGSQAFPLVVAGRDGCELIASIVQAAGVGPLRVNTAVANWPESDAAFYSPLGVNEFGRNVSLAFRLGTNLLLLEADAAAWDRLTQVEPQDRVIDVWWRDSRTGELMLLLAYLMTRSEEWERARIRLLSSVPEGATADDTAQALTARLEEVRITAEVVIVKQIDDETVIRESANSSLVFLPFRVHAGRFFSPFGLEIAGLIGRLPIVALALAAQDVDLDADPDEPAAETPADAAPSPA